MDALDAPFCPRRTHTLEPAPARTSFHLPGPCTRAGEPSCTCTRQAWELGARELQVQAWGGSADALTAVGAALARLDAADRIVVKLPATRDGVAAAAALCARGVRVTLTGAASPEHVPVLVCMHTLLLRSALALEPASG